MEENKVLLVIVAIVAIVAVFSMVYSQKNAQVVYTFDDAPYYEDSSDLTGEAIRTSDKPTSVIDIMLGMKKNPPKDSNRFIGALS